MSYLSLLGALVVDLVGIVLLAYVVYYRRHRRRDLLLAYFALNIGLFVVVSTLANAEAGIGLGFGLFAILSIIRLRSDAITQEEVAYYFVTLVMGLVNGLRLPDLWMTALLNAVLILVMYVVDHRRVLSRAQRQLVTLDVIHGDAVSLVADLERRLGGRVLHHVVNEVDFVRDVTVVDVRYLTAELPEPPDQAWRTGSLAAMIGVGWSKVGARWPTVGVR